MRGQKLKIMEQLEGDRKVINGEYIKKTVFDPKIKVTISVYASYVFLLKTSCCCNKMNNSRWLARHCPLLVISLQAGFRQRIAWIGDHRALAGRLVRLAGVRCPRR